MYYIQETRVKESCFISLLQWRFVYNIKRTVTEYDIIFFLTSMYSAPRELSLKSTHDSSSITRVNQITRKRYGHERGYYITDIACQS